MERLEWTAMLIEMGSLLAFLRNSGRAARPLVGTGPAEHGFTFWRCMFGGGLVLPWLLQTFSLLKAYSEEKWAYRGDHLSIGVIRWLLS
jgi:hypothetical protein